MKVEFKDVEAFKACLGFDDDDVKDFVEGIEGAVIDGIDDLYDESDGTIIIGDLNTEKKTLNMSIVFNGTLNVSDWFTVEEEES